MLKQLENKYQMFKAVEEVLENSRKTWKIISVMEIIFSEFSAYIQKIESLRTMLDMEPSNELNDKLIIEDQLKEQIYIIASAIYTYAQRNNNIRIKEHISFDHDDLELSNGTELVTLADKIIKIAGEFINSLTDYGIDSNDLDILKNLRTNYAKNTTVPWITSAERRENSETLKRVFAETTELLEEQLDKMMASFKIIQPYFFNDYINARSIIEMIEDEEQEENMD